MPFVRMDKNLPQDPSYPVDLINLDFVVNGKGQFVHKDTGRFYDYFITDNERANLVHKEAMYECVRQLVKKQLAAYGVQQVYLAGPEGAQVVELKPRKEDADNRHASLFTTNLRDLKHKQDVIVIIGEHVQDASIFTFRELMHERGMDGGSLTGLMEKLGRYDVEGAEKDNFEIKGRTVELKPQRRDSVASTVDVPGVIMLNPGQLLYSWELNRTMSSAQWQARKRKNGVTENSIEIDEDWNHVPGHKDSREHIKTVFERVIPQLVAPRVNLFIVGIVDGAEVFIDYMDAKLSAGEEIVTDKTVKAMAFMHSSHNVARVKSDECKYQLHARGKNWACDSRPPGTVLATSQAPAGYVKKPARARTATIETVLADAYNPGLPDPRLNNPLPPDFIIPPLNPFTATASSSFASLSSHKSSESLRKRRAKMFNRSPNDPRYFFPDVYSDWPSHPPSPRSREATVAGDVPTAAAEEEKDAGVDSDFEEEFLSARDAEGDFADDSSDTGLRMAGRGCMSIAERVEMELKKAREEKEEKKTAKVAPDTQSEETLIAASETSEESTGGATLTADPEAAGASAKTGDGDWEDYGPVSCLTVSSGVVSYADLIFPKVMGEVLGWFEEKGE